MGITTNYVRMIGIGSYAIYGIDESYDYFGEGSTFSIDFEKIVPSPKTKEEYLKQGGAKYKTPEEEGIMPVPDRPWFNWFAWTKEHWGACGNMWPAVIVDDDEIHFHTLYEVSDEIFKALSKMHPLFELDVSSDLAEGNTVNQTWLNGECTYHELHKDFEEVIA